MVLRFTAEDVSRVQLARTIGPLAEAVQAMGAMLRPQPLGPARRPQLSYRSGMIAV